MLLAGMSFAKTLMPVVFIGACVSPPASVSRESLTKEAVRAAERERLQALVDADYAAAARRLAPDFQVINPLGRSSSKEEYIRTLASGENDYLSWVPGEIEVRLDNRTAAVRYRSDVELAVSGRRMSKRHYWNTGLYEYRNGRWQIVWFQVTQINPPAR
jgi:hypothetical protein